MTERSDVVWKSSDLAQKFLSGVRRGGIPLAAEQLQVMCRLIDASGPISRFLDLGCGDGILGAAILERHPRASGILADFSEPMLSAAREKLASFADQLTFLNTDYATPGWQDDIISDVPFDAIVSGFSIHHQSDERKRALYAEILELLRPGGIFINIEHVTSETPWILSVWDDMFIDSLYAANQREQTTLTREQVAQEYNNRTDRAANILTSVETQCAWLREIGYDDVGCYFKVFEMVVLGGRRKDIGI